MMAQGTDGVSMGSLKHGVDMGKYMLYFCPWRRLPIEAEPQLRPWMEYWLPKDTIFLTFKDWFVRGHDIYYGKC